MLKSISCGWLLLVLMGACTGTKKSNASAVKELVVLSYNIHHGNPPTQAAGVIELDTIAATIRSSGADLVAIQELDSVTDRSSRVDQLQVLAKKLGMYYRFERTIPYKGGAYGIGILSRFPLEELNWFPLPSLEGIETEPRKLLVAKLQIGGEPFYFACTHFDYKNKQVKLAQAKELVRILGAYGESRVVVAGDFNAVPDDESIRQIETQFRSSAAPTEFTIPVLKPTKKIDYIFYRDSGLELLQNSVLTTHSYGSDHLPVKAVFRLR